MTVLAADSRDKITGILVDSSRIHAQRRIHLETIQGVLKALNSEVSDRPGCHSHVADV